MKLLLLCFYHLFECKFGIVSDVLFKKGFTHFSDDFLHFFLFYLRNAKRTRNSSMLNLLHPFYLPENRNCKLHRKILNFHSCLRLQQRRVHLSLTPLIPTFLTTTLRILLSPFLSPLFPLRIGLQIDLDTNFFLFLIPPMSDLILIIAIVTHTLTHHIVQMLLPLQLLLLIDLM